MGKYFNKDSLYTDPKKWIEACREDFKSVQYYAKLIDEQDRLAELEKAKKDTDDKETKINE